MTGAVSAQSPITPRAIEKGRGNIADPVRIQGIFYDGKQVKPRAPFDAPDDWLNHVTVQIVNLSKKNLIAGSIRIGFRESGEPMVIDAVPFGRVPENALYTPSGRRVERPTNETPAVVKPGESIIVKLSEETPTISKLLRERNPELRITTCWIDLGAMYFQDGTKWILGTYSREDYSKPGTYRKIEKEDF